MSFPTPTPSRGQSQDVFDSAMGAFVAYLPTFEADVTAMAAAMNLNDTTDVSASSVLIGLGAKTFTVSAGKSFQPGMYLVVADAAAPSTNSMVVQVTSYSGTSLVTSAKAVRGSGTIASWVISLSAAAADIAQDIHAATNKATPVGADEVGIWDSVSGLLNRVSFTNLAVIFAVDETAGTVASSTTPDIFAIAANVINYTGTDTATGFAAASVAGQKRTLICDGESKFTSGANLLIAGVPSGNTVTMAADAIVEVVALTTTKFKITYRVSGSFTITGTGFVTNPTKTATYVVENGFAKISILSADTIYGSSNATTFTLTGLPASLVPASQKVLPLLLGHDNSANTIAIGIIASGAAVITLRVGVASAGWTAAGSKGLNTSELYYSVC